MQSSDMEPSNDEQLARFLAALDAAQLEVEWRMLVTHNHNRQGRNEMANINDVYKGSNSLNAADLKGRAHLLKIGEVTRRKFDDAEKLVISFSGRDKTLVVNKTNAKMFASKLGDDYDRWAGHEIEVYPDKTMFGAELVDCIRVRFPIPAATAADGDEIPF